MAASIPLLHRAPSILYNIVQYCTNYYMKPDNRTEQTGINIFSLRRPFGGRLYRDADKEQIPVCWACSLFPYALAHLWGFQVQTHFQMNPFMLKIVLKCIKMYQNSMETLLPKSKTPKLFSGYISAHMTCHKKFTGLINFAFMFDEKSLFKAKNSHIAL